MSAGSRVDLEPAYILHARGYRETSQLLEVFTHEHGRLGLVARGARRPKSVFRGLLSPFQPLRLSWSGRGELLTLRDAELAGQVTQLRGDYVLSGFYLNELLLRFVHRDDPHPALFALYSQAIADLATAPAVEPVLRHFELGLLAETGYALNLQVTAEDHAALDPQAYYDIVPAYGAMRAVGVDESGMRFSGAVLLAIASEDFSDPAVLNDARRLLRNVINFHLGDRGLRTRQVAAAMKR